MLQQLSDDCQFLIINKLKLFDQMRLWAASTDKKSIRLNSNVLYIWQHKRAVILYKEIYQAFQMHSELVETFLSTISTKLEKLKLKDIGMKHLKLWKKYNFPNLRELDYDLGAYVKADRVIRRLTIIFPNVISVRTFGDFDCGYVHNWKKLRVLDLSLCQISVGLHYNIMSLLKCKQLEKIIVDCDNIDDRMAVKLLDIPKLNTLCLAGSACMDGMLAKIAKARGEHITELVFHDYHYRYEENTLALFKNIRKLTIIEDFSSDYDLFSNLISKYPFLLELHLIETQKFESEIQFWHAIDSCKTLEVLNMTDRKLLKKQSKENADVMKGHVKNPFKPLKVPSSFFAKSRYYMKRVLDKRAKPLNLHLNVVESDKELILKNFCHLKLNVSFHLLPFENTDFGSIQLKFLPKIELNSSVPSRKRKFKNN